MRNIEEIFREILNEVSKNSKKLMRSEVYGLIISSVWTPDCGFETAIIDNNGIYVVERYESEKKMIVGHRKWCKKAKTIKIIKELSWLGITDEEDIVLERNFDITFLEKHGMNVFKGCN